MHIPAVPMLAPYPIPPHPRDRVRNELFGGQEHGAHRTGSEGAAAVILGYAGEPATRHALARMEPAGHAAPLPQPAPMLLLRRKRSKACRQRLEVTLPPPLPCSSISRLLPAVRRGPGPPLRLPAGPGRRVDRPDGAALRQPRRHEHQGVGERRAGAVRRPHRRVQPDVALPPPGVCVGWGVCVVCVVCGVWARAERLFLAGRGGSQLYVCVWLARCVLDSRIVTPA